MGTAKRKTKKKGKTKKPRAPADHGHTEKFLDIFGDDLRFAFARTERMYAHAPDRGEPRERVWRDAFRSYFPIRVGITAGHVVSSNPAWSRQSDVIFYDALNAPAYARDPGRQGDVISVESVFGTVEVKSILTRAMLVDALDKAAIFKSMCGRVQVGRWTLNDRFAAIVAYRVPGKTAADRRKAVRQYVDLARERPEPDRVDAILVVGEKPDRPGHSFIALNVPKGGPSGPRDYSVHELGRRCLQVFLVWLDFERLRSVRTGPPSDIGYLMAGLKTRRGNAAQGASVGDGGISSALAAALNSRLSEKPSCSVCGSDRQAPGNQAFLLVEASDFHFGRLGAPHHAVGLLECLDCHHIALFLTKPLNVTSD